MEAFFKFPKTPHIAGSSVVDDDEVMSDLEVSHFILCVQDVVNSLAEV
jgi:hypothetical protein